MITACFYFQLERVTLMKAKRMTVRRVRRWIGVRLSGDLGIGWNPSSYSAKHSQKPVTGNWHPSLSYIRPSEVQFLKVIREKLKVYNKSINHFCRLRQVEIDAPEIQSGLTNDFQEARDRVDQVYLQTMLKDGAASEPGTSAGLTANVFIWFSFG